MTQFTPVVFPQPGEDQVAWARSMLVQLDLLQKQLVTLASSGGKSTGGGGGGASTTPITKPSGEVVMNVDGHIFDKLGRVVVTEDGIFVYDLVGFPVIEGPVIRINTDHLADNAISTAKLANGAITSTKIADDSIESPHIAAGAIVAGKIGVNAIVANDGVIGVAAIASAQIAELNASKILAGDIAAERMSANIVNATAGRFATLSALVGSLGIVKIMPGGALLTQNATAAMSGDGVWIAENKFRAGDPTKAYIYYDGNKITLRGDIEIVGPNGEILLAAGVSMDWQTVSNDVEVLKLQMLYNSAAISDVSDDNLLTPLDKRRVREQWDKIVAERPSIIANAINLKLSYTAYQSTFQALANYLHGGSTWTSGIPLFISDSQLHTTNAISGALMRQRLTDFSTQRQLLLNNIDMAAALAGAKLGTTLFREDGTPITNADLLSVWNRITSTNVGTFIQGAAIGTAQIKEAAIDTLLVKDGAISRAKIADLAVDNAKIANLAVDSAKIASLSIGGIKVRPPISGSVYLTYGQWVAIYHGIGRKAQISIYRVDIGVIVGGSIVSKFIDIQVDSQDTFFSFGNYCTFGQLYDHGEGFSGVNQNGVAATVYYTYS